MKRVPDPVPEHLRVLTSTPTEMEASVIVSALEGEGIEAMATGGAVSSFKVGVPEWVKIMVAEYDLPVARNTLERLKEEVDHIDWSQIDVGHRESGEEE